MGSFPHTILQLLAVVLAIATLAAGSGAITPTPDVRPTATPVSKGEVTVTLFHATHIHGDLVRDDGISFAHYAGLMESLRANLPRPGYSLFLGNGDDLSLSLRGTPTGGRHIIDSYAAAGLDATTFGYELNLGPNTIRKLVAESPFLWVSANVRDPQTGKVFGYEVGARRWVIKEIGGVRFGITGLVSPDIRVGDGAFAVDMRPDFLILDPVKAMQEVVPQMRADEAQVVVLLSHLFREQAERVAQMVEGVDVSVGAHHPQDQPPEVVNHTIVTNPWHDMRELGQLDLTIKDGHIIRHTYRAHRVTTSAPVHPEVKAILDRYLQR